MLTATTTRAARYRACPLCGGVLIRLKLDAKHDREMFGAAGFDLERPVYECPSADCGFVGHEWRPSPAGRELVFL